MSDKYLSEREWKNAVKNPACKPEPLAKALAALAKAEKDGPQAQQRALDEVDKQVALLLKAHKDDKVLLRYLGEMSKAAEKARQEAAESEDDEPDDALLDPKKLLAQLNLCKRDPERTVQFAYVDGKDKQAAALAMSPKASGRKLFARLQEACGVKTGAYGTAWVDGTVLMLQLDKPLGGLVKKVRGPVKECGFRITKAVLWNADGTVFEEDVETDPPADEPGPTTDTPNPQAEGRAPDAGQAFKDRLAALMPRLQGEGTQDARLKASEAGVMARKGQFDQAMGLLDEAEGLLARQPGPQDPPGSSSGVTGGDALARFKTRLAAFLPRLQAAVAEGHPRAAAVRQLVAQAGERAKAGDGAAALELLDQAEAGLDGGSPGGAGQDGRLKAAIAAWREASETVDAQLSALQRVLKASDDSELAEIGEFGINAVTGNHRVRLMASVMELERSQEGPALRALAQKALPLATGLDRHLASDERVEACDENPFGIDVSIRTTLGGALKGLADALTEAAA